MPSQRPLLARARRAFLAAVMALAVALSAATVAPSTLATSSAGYTIRQDRTIGYYMMWPIWPSAREWSCLSVLWTWESSWRWWATNPYSGAYGIPQAWPAWKMATAGSDWRWDPRTQIKWGLGYIRGRYGDPCGAYYHELRYHWY